VYEEEKIMAARVNELIAEVNRLNKIKNDLQRAVAEMRRVHESSGACLAAKREI